VRCTRSVWFYVDGRQNSELHERWELHQVLDSNVIKGLRLGRWGFHVSYVVRNYNHSLVVWECSFESGFQLRGHYLEDKRSAVGWRSWFHCRVQPVICYQGTIRWMHVELFIERFPIYSLNVAFNPFYLFISVSWISARVNMFYFRSLDFSENFLIE